MSNEVLTKVGNKAEWAAGGGSGEITTLHINVTAINQETMEATFTADKTPEEMRQASVNGPTWCVATFEAGTMGYNAVSLGIPPAWFQGASAFGAATAVVHKDDGNNEIIYAVREENSTLWALDLNAFLV